jgi:2-polyprenyl-3-methyl-5-hydroxy-6-metoxy-1,4-benzoquinol methylase
LPRLFSKRIIEPELLDHLPPEEARLNLADLVRINRSFGGHSVIRKTLAQVVAKNDAFTLLDIGAASGDTARLVQALYPAASVTSLDLHSVNLEAAPAPKLIANAFEFPFPDESFDFAIASLFLHHFADQQVSELLRSFYRLTRRALLVCDLERHILPYCFLPITKPLFGWKHATVHDGCISVRAAFRPAELLQLANRAGIEHAEVETHRPAFRLSLVCEKRKACV